MTKVLIVEDELAALQRLEKIINEVFPESTIVGTEDSIESTIDWFNENSGPDLIFMDIHLADGLSFEIFNKISIKVPIIFTTAYDQYAIQAFKVNSVDYLLKPIKTEELAKSVEKYKQYVKGNDNDGIDYEKIAKLFIKGNTTSYQERIVVKYGQKIKTIEIINAAYFYTAEKVVFLCTKDGSNYPIDFNLDNLESMLDPKYFYRINRQFIINIGAIKEMFSYSKSRVKILLDPPSSIETIVSTDRSGKFKSWLGGDIA